MLQDAQARQGFALEQVSRAATKLGEATIAMPGGYMQTINYHLTDDSFVFFGGHSCHDLLLSSSSSCVLLSRVRMSWPVSTEQHTCLMETGAVTIAGREIIACIIQPESPARVLRNVQVLDCLGTLCSIFHWTTVCHSSKFSFQLPFQFVFLEGFCYYRQSLRRPW